MRKQYNDMCRGNVRVMRRAHLEYEGGMLYSTDGSGKIWVVKIER